MAHCQNRESLLQESARRRALRTATHGELQELLQLKLSDALSECSLEDIEAELQRRQATDGNNPD